MEGIGEVQAFSVPGERCDHGRQVFDLHAPITDEIAQSIADLGTGDPIDNGLTPPFDDDEDGDDGGN
jgi:hypothetical protein